MLLRRRLYHITFHSTCLQTTHASTNFCPGVTSLLRLQIQPFWAINTSGLCLFTFAFSIYWLTQGACLVNLSLLHIKLLVNVLGILWSNKMIPRLMAAWNTVYLLAVTMLGRFQWKKRKCRQTFPLSSVEPEEFALDRVLRQIKQLSTCFNLCCFFPPTMQAFVYCFIAH